MPIPISIITICKNAEDYIEFCIQSVIEQDYGHFEYIIIDGDSTDNTLSIIERYQSSIDTIISETDCGIADAMNKGIKYAKGEYIFFLHSDDFFYSYNALSSLMLSVDQDCAIYYFNLFRLENNKYRFCKPRGYTYWMNYKPGIFHQGMICRKDTLLAFDCFDSRYKVAMDYDFLLKAYRSDISVKYVPIVLCVMRDTGISSKVDALSITQRLREEYQIHLRHSKGVFMDFMYGIYWRMYSRYRGVDFDQLKSVR